MSWRPRNKRNTMAADRITPAFRQLLLHYPLLGDNELSARGRAVLRRTQRYRRSFLTLLYFHSVLLLSLSVSLYLALFVRKKKQCLLKHYPYTLPGPPTITPGLLEPPLTSVLVQAAARASISATPRTKDSHGFTIDGRAPSRTTAFFRTGKKGARIPLLAWRNMCVCV